MDLNRLRSGMIPTKFEDEETLLQLTKDKSSAHKTTLRRDKVSTIGAKGFLSITKSYLARAKLKRDVANRIDRAIEKYNAMFHLLTRHVSCNFKFKPKAFKATQKDRSILSYRWPNLVAV